MDVKYQQCNWLDDSLTSFVTLRFIEDLFEHFLKVGDHPLTIVEDLEAVLDTDLSAVHQHQLLSYKLVVHIHDRPCAQFTFEHSMATKGLQEVD